MNNLYKSNLDYVENRGNKKSPLKKKLCFKDVKNNTINSLNEVEYFLNNFNKFTKFFKLYKLLK